MSEPEKRTPISVYLTPKATTVLHDYNRGSGYGSLSRTVEEIILAFDAVYKSTSEFWQTSSEYGMKASLSLEERAQLFLVLLAYMQNIRSALARLKPEGVES